MKTLFMAIWRWWQAVTSWYRKLPGWFRAAWHTAFVAYAAMMVPVLLAFVADVQKWIAGDGTVPDASVLGRTAASGFVAFIAFVINAVWRRWRSPENAYQAPPDPPQQ